MAINLTPNAGHIAEFWQEQCDRLPDGLTTAFAWRTVPADVAPIHAAMVLNEDARNRAEAGWLHSSTWWRMTIAERIVGY